MTAPPLTHQVLITPGQALDPATRAFMEPRFGQDFGGVRVHTDELAAESARAISALAYTVGRNIVFGAGQFAPETASGRRLLAHELTHVLQQEHGAAPARVQRQLVTPLAPGGGFGGLLDRDRQRLQLPPADDDGMCVLQDPDVQQEENTCPLPAWSPAPAPGVFPPSPPPPTITPAAILNFYHGTTWTIAKTLPGAVKPVGGGDFAAGFYTHHDANDAKALKRALTWARRLAVEKKEKYAGIVVFKVPQVEYQKIRTGGKFKEFPLTSMKQPDYKARQKEWLDFVTDFGREKQPVWDPDRGVWVHPRRDPQPKLDYDLIEGPFYTPLPGTAGAKPAPEEFKPYKEGNYVPHQFVWANKGIDLLNDTGKVATELRQYDAVTGDPVDPPVDTGAASPAPAPPVTPLLPEGPPFGI